MDINGKHRCARAGNDLSTFASKRERRFWNEQTRARECMIWDVLISMSCHCSSRRGETPEIYWIGLFWLCSSSERKREEHTHRTWSSEVMCTAWHWLCVWVSQHLLLMCEDFDLSSIRPFGQTFQHLRTSVCAFAPVSVLKCPIISNPDKFKKIATP